MKKDFEQEIIRKVDELEEKQGRNSTNISLLANDFLKVNNKFKEIELLFARNKADIEAANNAINQIAADSVIIGNQNYSAQYRVFTRKANRRIHELVGDPTTDEYILFQPFFRSGIYKDIADSFDLSSWKQISMVNYSDDKSMYNAALRKLEDWKPSKRYFNKRLAQLIEKRDNGVLATERCKALTRFLNKTDNARNIPFIV